MLSGSLMATRCCCGVGRGCACWGSTPPKPTAFTKTLVEGRDVRLEFDHERTDRYGRILAFVYVGDQLLNEELVRAGLSPAETRFPYRQRMKRRLINAEREARTAKRGLWSSGR